MFLTLNCISVIRGRSNIAVSSVESLDLVFMTHRLTTRVPCQFQISVLNDTLLPWPLEGPPNYLFNNIVNIFVFSKNWDVSKTYTLSWI